MNFVTVYGLCSKHDGRIRYVGQTNTKLKYRLHGHVLDAMEKRNKMHCGAWIRKMLSEGDEILIFEIEKNAVRNEAEKRLIAWYKSQGAKLTNISPGGDGNAGPRSIEHRKAIGDAHRGRKKSEEHKKRISKTLKGRPLPPALIEAVKTGKNRRSGYLPSFLGGKHTEESRKKMSQWQIGRKFSEATRQKMREASAKRWARA